MSGMRDYAIVLACMAYLVRSCTGSGSDVTIRSLPTLHVSLDHAPYGMCK